MRKWKRGGRAVRNYSTRNSFFVVLSLSLSVSSLRFARAQKAERERRRPRLSLSFARSTLPRLFMIASEKHTAAKRKRRFLGDEETRARESESERCRRSTSLPLVTFFSQRSLPSLTLLLNTRKRCTLPPSPPARLRPLSPLAALAESRPRARASSSRVQRSRLLRCVEGKRQTLDKRRRLLFRRRFFPRLLSCSPTAHSRISTIAVALEKLPLPRYVIIIDDR